MKQLKQLFSLFLAAYTAVNWTDIKNAPIGHFLAAYTAVNLNWSRGPMTPSFLAAYTAVNS